MKWIGQHIWSFISRFRADVYLENIADHGSDPDRFLTIDSTTGKVSYRTGAEVLSDIGGASSSSDVTGITITADDAGTATDTSGDLAITITGGEGVDTTASGSTVTIAGEDASTTNKGIVELATTAETTTGTDTSRAVTPDGLKDGYEGSTNIDTLGTISSGTWQGTAIASTYLDAQTAHLDQDQTFTGGKTINSRVFTITGDTHGEAIGDIFYIGASSTTAGKIYYLRTNGGWAEADADTTAGSTSLLAVALGSNSTTNGMLIKGMVTLSEDIGGTENEGVALYLSTTAGTATVTAPSGSNNVVRVVGYSMCASSSPATGFGEDNQIWFNPDNTWVEIT